MNTQKIIVLGGSGFVGSRLVPRLRAAGHSVRVGDLLQNPLDPEPFVPCDVQNLESVVRACKGMDVIYNLAAVHRDDVRPLSLYQAVNVDGATQVCRAADRLGIRRLIFTSSVAVYGLPDRELDETAEPRPFNEYGRTKLAAEAVYQEWAREADRNLIIVRPTVIFGEGNRGNLFNLFEQIRSGRFLMIGHGRNRKSMAYVENAAAFLEHVLGRSTGQHCFNYVDKPDLDMNRLVALVRTALGRKPGGVPRLPYPAGYAAGLVFDLTSWLIGRNFPISSVRIKKFCASTTFSAARALATGFVPPVGLHEAIEKTLGFEYGPKPDPTEPAPAPLTTPCKAEAAQG